MEESEVFQPERMKRRLQDFLFPRRYFRTCVKGLQAVPAYFYHHVEREGFALICERIMLRSFRTVTFGELLDGHPIKEPAVLLTFDDGWSSVWSVAFPLAKRYGIKFTLFVNPKGIEDSEDCRSTLDDGVAQDSLTERDCGPRGMLTWGEVSALHKSGLVDVQSHSLHHGVVFISDQLLSFCTPESQFPLDGTTPLVSRIGKKDVIESQPPLGIPLYPIGPALASSCRFIENTRTRARCIQRVTENGSTAFFCEKGWRDALEQIVSQANGKGRWENEDERRKRYRNDLLLAKNMIEGRVPGAKVRAVALPWGAFHQQVPYIARDTGHEICVMAYPFPDHYSSSPLPLYPRLYGDAIWALIYGPIRGGLGFWRARRRNLARRGAGAIP